MSSHNDFYRKFYQNVIFNEYPRGVIMLALIESVIKIRLWVVKIPHSSVFSGKLKKGHYW